MNRARHARLGLAVAAAGALSIAGLSGTAQAADVNNAKNAGFESGLGGWSCSAGSGATVSSPVHGGTAALKATPSGSDTAQCAQTVAVKPNSTYTLSAWVQGSYVYLGASGTGTTDVSTWTPGTGSGYGQLTTTFNTGASTTSVQIYTHGWYGQPAYYADDISVYGPDGGGGGDPAPTIPAAPGGLAVGSVSSSSVNLSWGAVSNATGYNVYQGGTKVQSVTGSSATVTGLSASTSYQFQVTATNAAGESPKSAAVTGTTSASRRHPAGGGDRTQARGDRLLAELQQRRDRPEDQRRAGELRHHRGRLRGRHRRPRARSASRSTRPAWAATPSTSSRRTSRPSTPPASR